jgi:hypothetical protein
MEGEAVGVIILVDVINTGSFLPPLSSWGSPRGKVRENKNQKQNTEVKSTNKTDFFLAL